MTMQDPLVVDIGLICAAAAVGSLVPAIGPVQNRVQPCIDKLAIFNGPRMGEPYLLWMPARKNIRTRSICDLM